MVSVHRNENTNKDTGWGEWFPIILFWLFGSMEYLRNCCTGTPINFLRPPFVLITHTCNSSTSKMKQKHQDLVVNKDCTSQRHERPCKKTHRICKPGSRGVHRVWTTQPGSLDGTDLGSVVKRGLLVWLLTVGAGACLWLLLPAFEPFSLVRLPCSALLWEEVPSLTATWYAMFGWYSWEACPFLKRNGGVDGIERRGRRGNCGLDIKLSNY